LAYPQKVAARVDAIESKLEKISEKALHKLQRQEEKMRRKLSKIDSLAAATIFDAAMARYKSFEHKLQAKLPENTYLPSLDTLATSLKFLSQAPGILSNVNDVKDKVKDALSKVESLKAQFQKAEQIKQFIRERKQFLKQQLQKFGFAKELKKINKQAYYYTQAINEYKDILKDQKKIEKKAIELLCKTKLFKDFMKKNSMLASLFPTTGNNFSTQATQSGFAGLQTRAQLTSFMQQGAGAALTNNNLLQRNIQDAQSQITQIRNELSRVIGGGSEDLEMPDFKPNSQKTKSFLKRLEYGTSFQSQKASSYFPTTTDIGLSAGYKLNDKSVIGIGASYKIGWGNGWKDIHLTNQGVGLRSFIDWKIKGSLWITGGYEQNYRSLFNSITSLRDLNAWQKSGLLGLTKVIALKTKFLKKTRMQLLWDFLSYNQRPITQPLVFRIGYNF
jgi:hypothetical protein